MFSAMLLAISIVALAQFGLYYWRAVLTGVAAQPISNRVLEAAQLEEPDLRGKDFEKLAGLLTLTPELEGHGDSLGPVRAYYAVVGFLGSRYTAVQVERRLEANLAQAASLRSC